MSEATLKKEIVECFVIMPISNQNDYDDGHFTLVYEDIIKPAIQANNMRPIRADETKNTNLIQLDILRRIIETPIAICDMSSKNPNVFYELGMRQAFDMPTVLIKDDETTAPFDISGLRYITYNKNMKHREVQRAVEELSKCIKETYLKKDDKSEINSLIRLMELTTPASFNSMNISESEKIERLQELELKDIKSAIIEMSRNQNQLLKEFSILRFKINKENHKNNSSIHGISYMPSLNDLMNKVVYNIDEPPEIS
jgi:hypothetical protein